jgi:Zn-dependent metalloprotease
MNKILPLVALCLCTASGLFAQGAKKIPLANHPANPQANLNIHPFPKASVPTAENVFGLPVPERQPITLNTSGDGVRVTLGDNGLPILFQGKTMASGSAGDARPATQRAVAYFASLRPASINDPATEFVATRVQTDEQGNQHVRLEQRFQGIPVFGSELIAHSKNGSFEMANGRYYPTPTLKSVAPALNATTAIQQIVNQIGASKVKTSWTDEERQIIGGEPFRPELVVYHLKNDPKLEVLAWFIEAHPNLMSRMMYFIDAQTGEILNQIDATCSFDGALNGPVTASGADLKGITRSFGAWDIGGQYVLEDASKSMFNASSSSMPDNPVGAIVTLNALNTSPETQSTFNYDFVKSASTTFSNPTAVSAHYNAIQSFDYYKNTFNRNSIDGNGGNILSFVNVANSDGSSMENAYWNGAAMWYGNGGSTFKILAGGLDVGGHEMTHGVVEKTANLVYQDESGALNESFADVFATLIDRSNWTIGEDVMKSGVNATGLLRDLSNPHNGAAQGSPWWQPANVSEQYTGGQDNGGVHINSGIPNHAYYLFASDPSVGKDKAEQVYYKALRDYLVKSSKFVDCRIAVLQAANDLYGSAVANVAANAFAAVGIGGSAPSGNYLGQLNPNPGNDYFLCATNDQFNVELYKGDGTLVQSFYNQGIISRPSVTDNGMQAVFVNANHEIVGVDFSYNTNIVIQSAVLSADTVWRNVAISKDGRFIAGLTTVGDNKIVLFDLADPNPSPVEYFLFNPTYSQGNSQTNDVQYADILEFDYSGTSIMYDAFNKLANSQGQDISYWDIGFLKFWDNGQFANSQTPSISKLFTGLPEKTSIADPTFAKNSPFIIAFDLYQDLGNGNYNFYTYGANIETGDNGPIVSDANTLGYPSFTRLDDQLFYMSAPGTGGTDMKLQGLKTSKIEPQGGSSTVVNQRQWGTWFGNGSRSLMVNAQEASSKALTLAVSPNPTSGLVSLSFDAPVAGDVHVVVFNMQGQAISNRFTGMAQGMNRFDVDLQHQPAGTYVVRVEGQHLSGVTSVIKQ